MERNCCDDLPQGLEICQVTKARAQITHPTGGVMWIYQLSSLVCLQSREILVPEADRTKFRCPKLVEAKLGNM